MAEPVRLLPAVVMFDLDGTLVDTMGALADLAAEVMASAYGAERRHARRLYLETSGLPFVEQLEVLFPGDPRNRGAAGAFEQRKGAICELARLDEPTVEVLAELRRRGLRLVVSSNSAQPYVDRFARGSAFTFDLLLGFGGGLAKGAPHVARVCAAFGAKPAEILFVGDSLKDGELAAKCGLRFVGRTGTFARAEFAAAHPRSPVIDRLEELMGLLED
jgi:phosphoglycolate phosphatase